MITMRPPTRAALLVLLIAIAPIHTWRAEAAEQTLDPNRLSVAAVQMRSTQDLTQNVARVCAAIAECATQGVRVVVFPECALTGVFRRCGYESHLEPNQERGGAGCQCL